ncbi:MAG: TraR/DksA family transcriptional regulator [bacterium]|nr:molecular chaperone DnaK [Deltaproteobacteria bacterium]MCP4906340.1 TraR/DksA family transcriptional regulator [bacterium]
MPLTSSERNELRKALESLVEELDAALAGSTESAQPVELDPPAVGRVSRIDAIQQQKMIEAHRRAQQSRLQLARSALRRLDEGEFGDCMGCGDEIGRARLEARPESLYCIGCQTARERP